MDEATPLWPRAVMPELQSKVSQSSKSQFPVGLNPGSPARASRVFMNVPPDPHLVRQSQYTKLQSQSQEWKPCLGLVPLVPSGRDEFHKVDLRSAR